MEEKKLTVKDKMIATKQKGLKTEQIFTVFYTQHM